MNRPRARALQATAWVLWAWASGAGAATQGRIVDLNNVGLPHAMVTLTKLPQAQGPTALTVFSDEHGAFAFPPTAPAGTLSVRLLGYKQVESLLPGDLATLLMRPEANQAGTAPASAYLRGITRDADREALIDTCVGCHQLPAPEVRAYAKLLDDTLQTPTPAAHEKSWEAVVQQMNYISAKEFSRAGGPASAGESVYSGGEPGPTAKLLAGALHGPLQEVRGYTYGAPLLVNTRTVIREYQVPEPNAIREAVTLDDASTLFAADVSSNRVFRNRRGERCDSRADDSRTRPSGSTHAGARE